MGLAGACRVASGIATWTMPSQMLFVNKLNDSSLIFSEPLPLEESQRNMWYRSCSQFVFGVSTKSLWEGN